ncbi:MAG: hypothetical protein J6Q14_08195 [Oscillospiraceae bacterium]|nr:hypothetical protein [Oscillospiraceae bacterium]
MMLFAKIKRGEQREENFYRSWDEYYSDTFSPDVEALMLLPFEIHGKTYAERKESLRNLAIDFQDADDGDADLWLSYGELSDIQDYFNRMGRRYGLLREFRENAIPC